MAALTWKFFANTAKRKGGVTDLDTFFFFYASSPLDLLPGNAFLKEVRTGLNSTKSYLVTTTNSYINDLLD